MTSAMRYPNDTSGPRQAIPRRTWMHVLLPREHGATGAMGEAVVFALLVSFDASAAALALSLVAAFLAWRPLRLLGNKRQAVAERRASRIAVAGLSIIAIAGMLGAIAMTSHGMMFLLPLALAIAPFAIHARSATTGRSRSLSAELCGILAISAVAPAIVLAGSGDARLALLAFAVMLAREVVSLFSIRYVLRSQKGQTPALTLPLAGGISVVTLSLWLMMVDNTVVGVALLLFATHKLAMLHPRWQPGSAKQAGKMELATGGALVIIAGLALRLG